MNDGNALLLLRHAILLQLSAAAPVPLPLATLAEGLRLAGHAIHSDQLCIQLDYLVEKGHIARACTELSSAVRRYRLTAEGRDYMEREGLL